MSRPSTVARELAPVGLRSSPKRLAEYRLNQRGGSIGAASQPSGSKLPRHKSLGSRCALIKHPPPLAWTIQFPTMSRPPLWRGSLLPLGCAAAPKRLAEYRLNQRCGSIGAASRPSGSKLPRHKSLGSRCALKKHPPQLAWTIQFPTMSRPPLWRGSLLPLGCAAAPKRLAE